MATAIAEKTDETFTGETLDDKERALFEGLEDVPEGTEAPEGTEPVAVAEEPEAGIKKPGVAQPAGKKDGTVPAAAVRAERGKTKRERERADEAENRWKAVEEEKNRLAGQLAARRPGHLLPDVVITNDDLARIRAAATKAGEDSETFAQLSEAVSDLLAREVGGRLSTMSRAVKDGLFEIRMEMLDHLAKGRHTDYEAVLGSSNITAGLQIVNGKAADEVLARKVFGSADPAEELYLLGVDKLKAEGRYVEPVAAAPEPEVTDEVIDEQPEPAPAPARAARRAEPAPAPRTIAEAEEAGAARVVKEVMKNGQRPRGIGAVPSAGAPSGGWGVTRRQIDLLADKNPDGYRRLMGDKPGLREWYLSGGE